MSNADLQTPLLQRSLIRVIHLLVSLHPYVRRKGLVSMDLCLLISRGCTLLMFEAGEVVISLLSSTRFHLCQVEYPAQQVGTSRTVHRCLNTPRAYTVSRALPGGKRASVIRSAIAVGSQRTFGDLQIVSFCLTGRRARRYLEGRSEAATSCEIRNEVNSCRAVRDSAKLGVLLTICGVVGTQPFGPLSLK